MNREVRTVRPFRVPHQFDEALAGVRFRMGGQVCEPDSSIVVGTDEEYLRAIPELIWADSDESLEKLASTLKQGAKSAGLELCDVELVATAYTKFLKIKNILFQRSLENLDSLKSRQPFNSPRPDALLASKSGAEITVCVSLSQQLRPQPLRPWRKATWLSKKLFAIKTSVAQQLFRPIPLDNDTRKKLNLPNSTVRFVDVEDPFEPLDGSRIPLWFGQF